MLQEQTVPMFRAIRNFCFELWEEIIFTGGIMEINNIHRLFYGEIQTCLKYLIKLDALFYENHEVLHIIQSPKCINIFLNAIDRLKL